MKTIFYSLIAITFFASCKKEEPFIPEIQEVSWKYRTINSDDSHWGTDTTQNTEMYNFSYLDELYWNEDSYKDNDDEAFMHWDLTSIIFDSFNAGFETAYLIVKPGQHFDFGYVQEHTNGTHDTIYGMGYFDIDTMYLNYSYQSIEDPDQNGFVNIHSY